MRNLVTARGLSQKELQDIRELEKVCSRYEKLNMKLNWDMLDKRPTNENNDFLYYEGNRLIGFLGLYGFGRRPKEMEITGMVHPEYRCKGVFKELFDRAKQECAARGVERILLITEESSAPGVSFAISTGAQYSFSEYRMKFEETAVPDFPKHGITLRKAEPRDYPELLQLDASFFAVPEEKSEEDPSNDGYDSTYVAELDGKTIGKAGMLMDGEDGYIFGFGIRPEFRRRGYGREVLSLALLKFLSERVATVLLEVAVKNEKALSLYKSCGFKKATVYDYYELVL